MDGVEAHFSTRTQGRRPKDTAGERLAAELGHTITLEQYRRTAGHRQPLYGSR